MITYLEVVATPSASQLPRSHPQRPPHSDTRTRTRTVGFESQHHGAGGHLSDICIICIVSQCPADPGLEVYVFLPNFATFQDTVSSRLLHYPRRRKYKSSQLEAGGRVGGNGTNRRSAVTDHAMGGEHWLSVSRSLRSEITRYEARAEMAKFGK